MNGTAIITKKIRMVQVTIDEMDRRLASPSGKFIGVPTMFDGTGRVWPKPEPGITVEFEE